MSSLLLILLLPSRGNAWRCFCLSHWGLFLIEFYVFSFRFSYWAFIIFALLRATREQRTAFKNHKGVGDGGEAQKIIKIQKGRSVTVKQKENGAIRKIAGDGSLSR